MRDRNPAMTTRFKIALRQYQGAVQVLPGIAAANALDCFVAQLVDSERRIEFVRQIEQGKIGNAIASPYSGAFNPLRASVLRTRQGNAGDAFWLVFLATHFGKHAVDGWNLTEAIYGGLDQGLNWNWQNYSGNPAAFDAWYRANEATIKGADGVKRRFSNHRKYCSLSSASNAGPISVFRTYLHWVGPTQNPSDMIRDIHVRVGQNPRAVFAELYRTSSVIGQFGRLAKFDFLTMLGKLGVAPIEPDSTYIRQGATGPKLGARLLFTGSKNNVGNDSNLGRLSDELSDRCGINFQAFEDAVCNWQKSPTAYKFFRG